MEKKRVYHQGIELKKKHGQHFLKNKMFIDPIFDIIHLDNTISVLEIGSGEGILTGSILQGPCRQLKVFEIDSQWANYVHNLYGADTRLHIVEKNILEVDWASLETNKPWVLIANLPYQITFPILHLLQQHRNMFLEGVVMVQEEVAQKIVKISGRGYGYSSLFFQYYFEWKLLSKVPPEAFYPQPKVFSRLLYFKPKQNVLPIENEIEFWKFIKLAFHQPRRTLRNNFLQSHYDIAKLDDEILQKRAQQLCMQDFIKIWQQLK